jgi:hypothetical protein
VNTAQDVVDYLLAGIGGGAQDGEHRAVRQAVVHGVREVMQCRLWLWHTKTNSFLSQNVSVPVAAGGITQGSSSITLSSTAQIVVGRLIQCAHYFDEPTRIVSVQPGNVVVVDKPAKATIAVGETQSLTMQTFYDLPEDLRDIDTLLTHTVGTLHAYISPQEWQRREIYTKGTGEPYYYTIMRSDSQPDCYQIRFVGIPTNGTTVHYTYRYNPRPIKYMGFEMLSRQGTVSAAGTAVTGANTDFPVDAVGSVIRFGTTTTDADPVGSLAPYLAQRRIVGRASATALTVDSAVTAPALTRYAISDPLDASPQMYTAILSACEMWYARIAGKSFDDAMKVYGRDLRIAMECDQVAPLSGRPMHDHFPTPRSMGWRSVPNLDVG